MENNSVYDKIKDSLDMIFSFALKRTNDRYEAEDLCQEIIMNLYSSAHGLKDIDKYYGWMWAVARNEYKAYLRKKVKNTNLQLQENIYTTVKNSVEDDLIKSEQIKFLYSELSILSGLYRETMCLYYLKHKSCEEIAKMLNISNNMVKQYLFKSRKKVKEGMSMIRESGERSFNPRKFNIYYWGEVGNYCNDIFKRKLPGNIMLEAYYEPVTIEELSIELGVATVYLEDEINILKRNSLLKHMRNDKVQSNIIILTEDFEKELYNKTKDIFIKVASYLYEFINKKELEIRSLKFNGSDMSKNTLVWQMASICFEEAVISKLLNETIKDLSTYGNDSQEYMWGLERVFGDNDFDLSLYNYEDREKNVIKGTDYYIVERKAQELFSKITGDVYLKVAKGSTKNLSPHEEEELFKLIQRGYVNSNHNNLSVDIPVYTNDQFNRLKDILRPAIEEIYLQCKNVMPITERILKNYTPSFLYEQVPVISALKQAEAFTVNSMSNMYLERYIEIPKPCNELLTAYVILAD